MENPTAFRWAAAFLRSLSREGKMEEAQAFVRAVQRPGFEANASRVAMPDRARMLDILVQAAASASAAGGGAPGDPALQAGPESVL